MGCSAIRTQCNALSENAGEFCGSCLGPAWSDYSDGRTDGIDCSPAPFLLQIALDIFGPLSLPLALSPHSTDPEAQKSPSLFLSTAFTGLCQNILFLVELGGGQTKIPSECRRTQIHATFLGAFQRSPLYSVFESFEDNAA